MVECGFRSRHQVIRDLGSDPATVDAQLEADTLDIRPTASAAPGTPENQPVEENEPMEQAA